MTNTTERSARGGNRRAFLTKAGSAGAAAAFAVMSPERALTYAANEKIRLGLAGCGGRGIWISRLFMKHGGYELTANADYFEDRVHGHGDLFSVPDAHRYTGLSSYKRMLDAGAVDAIAIESPPYFHPMQAAAAVEAGVHVYVAKPIAVDVPGCLSIGESAKKSTANKKCFLIDFQTRADPLFIEAIRRVREEGAIGGFAFGESSYHAGNPWEDHVQFMKADPKNPKNRLRAWGLDRVLSGDIITEQNIHTLDVASWILGVPPIRASGATGRKIRDDGGDCHDSFQVVFEYPEKANVSFSSRQFEGHGSAGGINNRMYGSKGVIETQYGGNVLIRGENPYEGGGTRDIFTSGVETNIATFHESILGGRYDNPTAEPSVRSNLVTILGRTAAYRGGTVYWDDMLKNGEALEFDASGLRD